MTDKTKVVNNDESVIELKELWFIAKKHWLIIMLAAFLGLVLGIVWTMNRHEQYQAEAVIQVKDPGSALSGLSGALSSLSNMVDSSAFKGDGNNLSNQQALLSSSVVLLPAIQKTEYNLHVHPHFFPIFGYWMYARHDGNKGELAPSLWGFDSYAWGGQNLQVQNLQAGNLPIQLALKAQDHDKYQLLDQDGHKIYSGQVGRPATFNTETNGKVKLDVTKLKARSGNMFQVSKSPALDIVKQVQSSLQINVMDGGQGQTNLLNLKLTTSEPKRAKQLLKAIIEIASGQNQERKARQAKQTLSFLREQIPLAKKAFAKAEHSLVQYKAKHGSIDQDLETQILMKRLSSYESSIDKLSLEKLAAKRLYTNKHPLVQAIDEKIGHIEDQEKGLQDKIKHLPESDQQVITLQQDAQVKSQLYSILLQKAQQLEVMKAGTLSDILTLQGADVQPLESKMGSHMMLLIFVIAGGILGFLLSVAMEFMRERGLQDLELLDDILGVEHQAIIPLSRRQNQIDASRRKKLLSQPVLLARNYPQDVAVEGIRSLKTALMMQLLDKSQDQEPQAGWTICLHGVTPGAGKSFLATNLSYVLANAGHKTLLLDADLRRSQIASLLQMGDKADLTAYLAGEAKMADIIHTWDENLDVVPTIGSLNDTAGHLSSDAFAKLIATLRQQYKFIIIDAPPILGVSDGLILGRYADYNMVIINAARDNIKELRYGFSIFEKSHCTIDASVINKLDVKQQLNKNVHYHYYHDYSKQD